MIEVYRQIQYQEEEEEEDIKRDSECNGNERDSSGKQLERKSQKLNLKTN